MSSDRSADPPEHPPAFEVPTRLLRAPVAPRSTDRRRGETVASRYQLTELLGLGGMGSVWRALHLTLGFEVALKLISPDIPRAEGSRWMQREAQAIAQLGHPSVCRIFDFGHTERQEPFIAMELLEGSSLTMLLRREGALPPPDAVRIVLPVLGALAAAHDHGIVHRDIKPGNIILAMTAEGVVPKLVDFGIAKLLESAVSLDGTLPGQLLGSPEYMAPEQAQGRSDVDARADVWGCCVVVYEAIAGERPFTGSDRFGVLDAIVRHDPETLSEIGRGDERLSAIIRRGLAKDRRVRWQSARELGRVLAHWALDQGVSTDVAGMSLAQGWLDRSG